MSSTNVTTTSTTTTTSGSTLPPLTSSVSQTPTTNVTTPAPGATITSTTSSNKILIIDNGAHTIKIAHSNIDTNTPIVIPNQVGKSKNEKKYIIGDDLKLFHNSSEIRLRNPMEKGYICNWSVEKEIWDHMFKREDLKVKPTETSLLLTEAPFALDEIRKALYETIYEQYKFKSLCLYNPSSLGLLNYKLENQQTNQNQQQNTFNQSPCQLVVDCGYSSTLIIPHFQNHRLNYAIKRCDVGGKLLTNYLKEVVSFRYWDMMHETRLINTIKERTCFISQDFNNDLLKCKSPSKSPISLDYILPDYTNNNNTGYIKNIDNVYFPFKDNQQDKKEEEEKEEKEKELNQQQQQQQQQEQQSVPQPLQEIIKEEQSLTLTNERFTIPELLFHPSDIGINQAGVAESIVQSINCTNVNMHQSLYSNILLLGGSTKFPGFKERLTNDLRKLAPDHFNINIYTTQDPILQPIYGGIKFSQQNDFNRWGVSKLEYEEHGYILCNRKFNN